MKRIYTAALLAAAVCLTACSDKDEKGLPEGDSSKTVSVLSRDSILIGDQVKWSLGLSLSDGEDFFIEQPEEPVAPGVETIRPWSIDTLGRKGGKLEVEGNMILTSFDSGSYFLPPLIVMVQREGAVDTLYYEGPSLEVSTVPIDTATFKPYDIKGQMTYPITFSEVLPWLLGAILLAALIFLIVKFSKNRGSGRGIFGKPKVQDPPHIVALRKLETIRGMKLWQNNKQKQFYTEVTDAVRCFVADTFNIPAMEQTSGEMFEDLKDKNVPQREFESLRNLFSTADYVKFAKHDAGELENEEAIPTATRFVNAIYMQHLEEEAAKKAEKEK